MSVFGIKVTDEDGEASFWVGEDDVMFDWLLSDEVELSDFSSRVSEKMRLVRAPVGYAFHYGSLLLKVSSEAAAVLPGLGDVGHVGAKYPGADKALMSLHLFKKVQLEEFEALNINQDRILYV